MYGLPLACGEVAGGDVKVPGIVFLICLSLGLVSIACQRNEGVRAAGESDYQPRPAPQREAQDDIENLEMPGELVRIDTGRKIFTVRVENGMIQTFKFDSDTAVLGIDDKTKADGTPAKTQNNVRKLRGKEGSEVSVQWRDQDGDKIATIIEVTQISSKR
jgi:hypothetical protein